MLIAPLLKSLRPLGPVGPSSCSLDVCKEPRSGYSFRSCDATTMYRKCSRNWAFSALPSLELTALDHAVWALPRALFSGILRLRGWENFLAARERGFDKARGANSGDSGGEGSWVFSLIRLNESLAVPSPGIVVSGEFKTRALSYQNVYHTFKEGGEGSFLREDALH